MKKCCHCHVVLREEDFHRGARACKVCARIIRVRRESDPEKLARKNQLDREARAQKRRDKFADAFISTRRAYAQAKGIEFSLHLHREKIAPRIDAMRCELSGIPLCMGTPAHPANEVSLARLDHAKGFHPENTLVVCRCLALAIGSWGVDALREVIASWLEKENAG